jgi:hypothetical protein
MTSRRQFSDFEQDFRREGEGRLHGQQLSQEKGTHSHISLYLFIRPYYLHFCNSIIAKTQKGTRIKAICPRSTVKATYGGSKNGSRTSFLSRRQIINPTSLPLHSLYLTPRFAPNANTECFDFDNLNCNHVVIREKVGVGFKARSSTLQESLGERARKISVLVWRVGVMFCGMRNSSARSCEGIFPLFQVCRRNC